MKWQKRDEEGFKVDFQERCLKVDARSTWMPDDSTCFPKFGMYNEITEQFVSNRDDKEGLRLDSMETGLSGST